jgi:L,D-transpeptidase YcbB
MKLIIVARRSGPAIASLCAVLLACDVQSNESNAAEWTPARVADVRGVPIEAIHRSIDSLLRGPPPASIDSDTWQHARGLYRINDGGPYWMTSRGLDRQRAGQLTTVLATLVDDALNPTRLPLDAAAEALEVVRGRAPTAEAMARSDVLLTAVYAGVAEQLLVGHVNPRSVSQSWYIDPREERVDSAMARMLRARRLDQAMDAMRPHQEAYDALRMQLQRYRQVVATGGWERLTDFPSLAPGDSAPASRLIALRERLRVEGFLDGRTSQATGDSGRVIAYDSVLAGAIARFQAQHGIVVDSAIGSETINSLNVPVEYRVAQIAANLERFRWLPRTLGTRYVLVNVPAFQLQAFDNGSEVLTMKVIVGAEYDGRSTPVFSDSMQTVVFRPYWNVTENIAQNEIWPKSEADPTYLERNNYEVVKGAEGPRIRQRPGKGNALGLVKFLFPNNFAIYLHDTPQDELFKEDVRAFSHGCIRVEKPAELAQYVLGWPADSVRRLMEGGKDDRHIEVNPKIPVYIVYLTTYMRDGELYFGNDLYSRDQALVEAVRGAAMPDAKVLQQIRRLRDVSSRWRFSMPFAA